MFKVIKYLFYVLALFVIAASVYIATLQAKFEHTYNVQFDKIPKTLLKNKLLEFEQWKSWAITDSNSFKVIKNKDFLQSSLQSSLTNKQEFKLENEQISDSIIVQKLYTTNENTIQTLTWKLGSYRTVNNLSLNIKEELSFSDKLHDLLKWENGKRSWLLSLENRLPYLKQQLAKQASDYTVGAIKKNTFGPVHYVYLTSSGNINYLSEQTEQHIIKLEQFLAENEISIAGKPFTIYNSDLENGDVLFSTALPVNNVVNVNVSNQIRYGFIDATTVFELEVLGNPRDMQILWKNLKESKEVTLTEMSNRKLIIYNTPINDSNVLSKKQKLLWEIEPNKEPNVALDSLKTLVKEPENTLKETM